MYCTWNETYTIKWVSALGTFCPQSISLCLMVLPLLDSMYSMHSQVKPIKLPSFLSSRPDWCIFFSTDVIISIQFSLVVQSSPTLCDPMNHSTPGLPVHHQLLEFTQTHVRQVGDAIQPSHPLSSPSPPAPNPSQHQSFPMSQLFTWGGQSPGVSALASFLPKNTQDWSPLEWTGWMSLQSKGISRVFSNTTVQKHQFFGAQLSSQSNSTIHTWLLEKP